MALLGLAVGGLPVAAFGQAPAQPQPVIDPVVAALLQTNPQSADELAEVIGILIDLKHAPQAVPLVERLRALNLDAGELARLAQRFGSPLMMKLALTPELQPAGMELATALAAARAAADRDPAAIATAIESLSHPELSRRASATARLRRAGPVAAGELVNVLADPAREPEARGVMAALIAFDDDALDPVAAALATTDPRLRHHLITVLSQMPNERAPLWLLRPALGTGGAEADQRLAANSVRRRWGQLPTTPQAAAELYQQARAIYNAAPPIAPPAAALRWTWNAEAGRVASQPSSSIVVDLDRAVRYADDALALAPRDPNIQVLHLALRLEAEVAAAGGQLPQLEEGSPLAAYRGTDPELLQAVARLAADAGHTLTAMVAVGLLDGAGVELLHARAPQPCTLVELCRHPDRNVRFEALAAVMALKPQVAFPGSSFVAEGVRHLLATQGAPRAIVGDLRPAEAQRLAGMLNELGFQVDVAYSPRDVLALALRSADVELALVDVTLAAYTSGELLSQLRRDARTARLPVAVVSSPFETLEWQTRDLESALLAQRIMFLDALAHRLHEQLDLRSAAVRSFERHLLDIAFALPEHESLYQRLRSPGGAESLHVSVHDTDLSRALDRMGSDINALEGARTRLARDLLNRASADFARAQTLELRDPRTLAFVRPYTIEAMQAQVARLLQSTAAGQVPAALRLVQAQQALAWLAEYESAAWQPVRLATLEGPLCEAAWLDGLSQGAIPLLARIGSAAAQTTLADVASLATMPLETRQAAAAAFAGSVERFGTLLNTGQIVEQYARYNSSETLDRPTQELLSSMLDAIEARATR